MQFAYVMEDGVKKPYPEGWVGIFHGVILYPEKLSEEVLEKHSMKQVRSLDDFYDKHLETIQKLTLIESATFEKILESIF